MRALRILAIVLVVLTFSPLLAHADQVYSVDMWGIYTATTPCTSNCTETITADFQFTYDPSLWPFVQIIPGSFSSTSSGFMGPLVSDGTTHGDLTIWFLGGGGEIDIWWGTPYYSLPGFFQFEIWACRSDPCTSAFGENPLQWSFMAPQEWSTTIKAPEPSSLALLPVPLIIFLLRKRRSAN